MAPYQKSDTDNKCLIKHSCQIFIPILFETKRPSKQQEEQQQQQNEIWDNKSTVLRITNRRACCIFSRQTFHFQSLLSTV